jgi:Skp family chaperone for outer membrane proteins
VAEVDEEIKRVQGYVQYLEKEIRPKVAAGQKAITGQQGKENRERRRQPAQEEADADRRSRNRLEGWKRGECGERGVR